MLHWVCYICLVTLAMLHVFYDTVHIICVFFLKLFMLDVFYDAVCVTGVL